MLTSVLMAQYQYIAYVMKPRGKPTYVYFLQPIMFGAMVGCGFGLYENVCYT